MALSGMGVGRVGPLEPLPPPPPEDPGAAVVEEPERVVPLNDVLVLEEMPVELLVLDRTLPRELELDDAESAELEFTVDAADGVL